MCLGGKVPPGFPVSRDPQALQEERGPQEGLGRKAISVKQAPRDLRVARETPVLLVLAGRVASQEPPDLLDPQAPLGPPGRQDQDSPLDLMIWKAPEGPSGRQLEALMGCRDPRACRDSRGILACLGHRGPREKLEQMEPLGSLASPAERALLGPRGQRETEAAGEKRETQGRTESGSQASPAPPDPRGLWSTCRSRTEPSGACRDPRVGPASQAFLDLRGPRATWALRANEAPQDPRVRRVSLAASSAPMAVPWALPRKEPRESRASAGPRAHTDGLGTRERLAFLDGRVAPG